jgi:hypothetical protein
MNNTIHTTKDYGQFKRLSGNRSVNKLHVDRIKKSMSTNYLFTAILVNGNFEILDGQHRFEAIKELNLPLNYIVVDQTIDPLQYVQTINQNVRAWSADSFEQAYCELGYDHYIKYRQFKKKYGFGHNECMAILTGANTSGSHVFNLFKSGSFKITHLKDAEEIANMICSLKDLYDGYKRRSFIFAILQLLDKKDFIFDEFRQKLSLNPSALKHCSEASQYIALIEDIYNYRRRTKVNLRY